MFRASFPSAFKKGQSLFNISPSNYNASFRISKCENSFQSRWASLWTKGAEPRTSNISNQYFRLTNIRSSHITLFQNAKNNVGIFRWNPSNLLQQQRSFRTTPKNDALPPFIVILIGRVANFAAVIFGRSVRRWWKKLTPEEKAKYAGRIRRNRYLAGGAIGAAAFGSFIYYETHVQVAPFTDRRRFIAFSNDQILEMSKMELEVHLAANEQKIIHQKAGTAVYKRIVRVAQQLLQANQDLPQLQGLEWTVTVVNEKETTNAYVLPCGSIFVFTGLLNVCDSDDQLGIILAHEMAHAVMGHGAEKASFLHFLDWMFVIPLAALWALLPSDLTAALIHWITNSISKILMELPHSRFIEEEADEVGLILAAKACFDIREAPVVWAKIGLMEQDNIQIEWLSTHPSHERRQAQLEKLLKVGLEHRELCQCPALPKFDPRLKIKAYQEGLKEYNAERRQNLAVPIKVQGL